MLLIITNRRDLACDYLVLRLQERGLPFARLNTDLYPKTVSFDIQIINNHLDYAINLDRGVKIRKSEVSAVYFRQPELPTFDTVETEVERAFAESELTEMLRSLWRVLPEMLWLNHPKNLWLASNKIEQLIVAVSVGFRVPDTLVSFSADSVFNFLSVNDRGVIAKAVKHGFVSSENKVLLAGTQRLSQDYIAQFDNFASVPMMYQEEVKRMADFRVVVVGEQLFATAITMGEHNNRLVDWRIADISGIELKHERAILPEEVRQQCFSIVRRFGLKYASIDLIQSQQGEYYFLELNPNGQWAWIEQLTSYPIRDAIIDTLLEEQEVGRIRD